MNGRPPNASHRGDKRRKQSDKAPLLSIEAKRFLMSAAHKARNERRRERRAQDQAETEVETAPKKRKERWSRWRKEAIAGQQA